jgi:hypothetical protein
MRYTSRNQSIDTIFAQSKQNKMMSDWNQPVLETSNSVRPCLLRHPVINDGQTVIYHNETMVNQFPPHIAEGDLQLYWGPIEKEQ